VTASNPVDSAGAVHGCWTNQALNGTHVFLMQDAGTASPKGDDAHLLEPGRTGRADRTRWTCRSSRRRGTGRPCWSDPGTPVRRPGRRRGLASELEAASPPKPAHILTKAGSGC
jgi:hypothetical protein